MSATQTPTNSAERRIAPRFQPAFGTICRLRPPGRPEPAVVGLVWNISETGVSMLIADAPARGSEFDAELTTESGADGLRLTIRVVHVREMPVGEIRQVVLTRTQDDDDDNLVERRKSAHTIRIGPQADGVECIVVSATQRVPLTTSGNDEATSRQVAGLVRGRLREYGCHV